MKLSAKQKEVIKLMREGAAIVNRTFAVKYWVINSECDKVMYLLIKTFGPLNKSGLIQDNGLITIFGCQHRHYTLSETGKTIDIN